MYSKNIEDVPNTVAGAVTIAFVKIGILGLGFMGATHIGAFSKLPGVEVAAVSSGNALALSGDLSQTGGNLGREGGKYDFSNVRKYTDWRDLVADPDLDAVDICLPTDLHAPAAVAALQTGKHVYCEKPMGLTADECDHMISQARQHNRILMVGQVLRFWPAYLYLKQFISGGEYGRIQTATFVRRSGIPDWSKWLTDNSRSGGAILDMLVHDLDQILWLFGAPKRVAGKSMGEIDTVSATFLYPNGPEVRVQGGWFAAGTPFAMGFHVRAERAELELTPEGLRLNDAAGNTTTVKSEGQDGYEAEAAYFVQCCETNTQPDRCPPEESAKAVKLALLLNQSRAEGGNQIECNL
jgi:Predicted dehydrogenases and related proteins